MTKLEAVNEGNLAKNMLGVIERNDVIKEEDRNFLAKNKESIQKTLVKTHMWRTKWQHESILSDRFFPSIHAKFHQALLEQKVHFEESIRLAKEYSLKELEIEGFFLDLEDLVNDTEINEKRKWIKERKIQIEITDLNSQLMQMRIAMDYRMKEIKSWEEIKDKLFSILSERGFTEEQIYDKEFGEFENLFYLFINNLAGVANSTDGAEVNNILALAVWAINRAKQMEIYDTLVARCSAEQLKLIKTISG